MMNATIRWTGRILTLPLLLIASAAHTDDFALGARIGTTGIGLEGTWRLAGSMNLRGGVYAFDYSTDLEEEGVEYDGDLRLRNFALFADWHPFGRAFRLSTGAVQSGNEFRGSADGELEIGNDTYEAAVDAKVGWKGLAPYLGLGFGNALSGGRVSFAFDLGVMFTGSPSVRLRGSATDPALAEAFAEDLAREEANLRDELSDAKYYPVVSLGIAFRF